MPADIPYGTLLLIRRSQGKSPSLRAPQQHYEETIHYTRSTKKATRWVKKTRKKRRKKAATRIQTTYRGIRDRKAFGALELMYFPHDVPTPGGYLQGLKKCITIQRYWRGALARSRVLLALTRHSVSLVQGPARMLHAARKLQALSAAVQLICQSNAGQERLTVHAAFRIANERDEAARKIQREWRVALDQNENFHLRHRDRFCCDLAHYYKSKYHSWLALLAALSLTTTPKIFKLFEKARHHLIKSSNNNAFIFDDSDSTTDDETVHVQVESDLSDILACLHEAS